MLDYDSAATLLPAIQAGDDTSVAVLRGLVALGLSPADHARLLEQLAPPLRQAVRNAAPPVAPGGSGPAPEPGGPSVAPDVVAQAAIRAAHEWPGLSPEVVQTLAATRSADLSRGFAAAMYFADLQLRWRLAQVFGLLAARRAQAGEATGAPIAPPSAETGWGWPPPPVPPAPYGPPPSQAAPPSQQWPGVTRPAPAPPSTGRPGIIRRLRGGRRHQQAPPQQAPPQQAPTQQAPTPSAPPPATQYAYPLLRCPHVWVSEEPVDVNVGLSGKQLSGVVATPGAVADVSNPITDLELLLVIDPTSIRVAGDRLRFPLPVTETDRFPSVTVSMTAVADAGLSAERRIGVQFLRDGRTVGFAWRRFDVVDFADEIAAHAMRPTERLVDLSPLIADDPPDLVLTITRGDAADQDNYVWSAYSSRDDVVVPDRPRTSRMDDADTRAFATNGRRTIATTVPGIPLHSKMVGRGRQIGQAVPAGIADVLRRVAARGGAAAPTVLLLTEDPYVPWELAVLPGDPAPAFGAESPFLGAHVAISRWPLNTKPPRTSPGWHRPVARAAVLTAVYDDVPKWRRLKHAEAEAAALAAAYPPMTTLAPLWDDVRNCLRGTPPVDLLHVALHGSFDADGLQDGMVLLGRDADGELVPQFLTTEDIAAIDLPTAPFVFLNACQVGAGNTVLASYSGMAASLVANGATGVVAPLWNIDDAVAAAVTERFYADVHGADDVPVAEALRRIRAGYTEAAVAAESAAETKAVTPTLIAYQFWGHPKLSLQRSAAG